MGTINLTLSLLDGKPDKWIRCTRQGWTSVAYNIPRDELDAHTEIDHLSHSGVYFLFGCERDVPAVYIGKAGARKNCPAIRSRLQEHRRDANKEFWTDAVAFTTKDDSFGLTEISYFENRFTNMARNAGRYLVKNGNEPQQGKASNEKDSEMEEFIGQAGLMIRIFGYRVFEFKQPASPAPATPPEPDEREARTWLVDVQECIKRIPSDTFSLSDDLYKFSDELKRRHPMNNNIEAKIRQQVQLLCENGVIEKLSEGRYKKHE